jgi:2-polyprenyl-6-methoxyphenol hydroxylase-like FAD-dependent oxidoreductase
MSREESKRTHALVIGGGIAGLLAARVLLRHFERVTVIERDRYPEEPVFRAGVPQGRHAHIMLLRGQQALETLFPGLKATLLAQGAVERVYGAEGEGASLYSYGGRCPQIPPVLRGWNCSRPFLEWHIRQKLAQEARLHIVEGHEVVHLLASGAEPAISGVQFHARTSSFPKEIQELRADLVVDASGASSRAATWLRELGNATPRACTIDICINYATCMYRPAEQSPWKEIALQTTQPGRPAGALMEIEKGRWLVSLTGVGSGQPFPKTQEDFLAFLQTLKEPALFDAVRRATPISPVYGYRKVGNYQRIFSRPPEGLIVLGDALCSLNPLYGQGMTIAALEALLLDACLQRHAGRQGFAALFQKKAAALLAFPWRLAATADAASRFTPEGDQARGFSYLDDLMALLPYDQQALLTFLEVIHMVRSPLALVHPPLVMKVLAHRWRTRTIAKDLRNGQ